jgi:hypothetical protein
MPYFLPKKAKITMLFLMAKCGKIGKKKGGQTMEELKPGRYRHFKGKEYRLLALAKHSETLESMVVYQALYGEKGLWVRPAAMWSETVKREGYSGPRFTYIGE